MLLPICTLAVGFLGWVRPKLGHRWVDEAVKGLLDNFRLSAFPLEDPEIEHRVTLFRHEQWHFSWARLLKFRNPAAGWLIPYERAGDFSLRSSTIFFAPKEEPDRCEGFAGKVFRNKNCEYLYGLPKIDDKAPDEDVTDYVRETNSPEEWVRQRVVKGKSLPRSFWGFHIEVDGSVWGVLLVDSRSERLQGKDELKEQFLPVGLCLSKILSRR